MNEIDNMSTRKEILMQSLTSSEGVALGFKNSTTAIFLRITQTYVNAYLYQHVDNKRIRYMEIAKFPNLNT